MTYGCEKMGIWNLFWNLFSKKKEKRDVFTVNDEINILCGKCAERIDQSMTFKTTDNCVIRVMDKVKDKPTKAKPKKVGRLRGKAGTKYDCPYFNNASEFNLS